MFEKNLNDLLLFLTTSLNEYDFVSDKHKVKYLFNELNKYFSPIYIEIKKQIHKEMVNKLRNENKKKRGIN